MIIISSGEFRANQKNYLDKVDSGVSLLIQRGKNRAYRIIPVKESDLINEIPVEHKRDPYKISPSGDPFWADERNLAVLERALELLKEQKSNTRKMSKKLQKELLEG